MVKGKERIAENIYYDIFSDGTDPRGAIEDILADYPDLTEHDKIVILLLVKMRSVKYLGSHKKKELILETLNFNYEMDTIIYELVNPKT